MLSKGNILEMYLYLKEWIEGELNPKHEDGKPHVGTIRTRPSNPPLQAQIFKNLNKNTSVLQLDAWVSDDSEKLICETYHLDVVLHQTKTLVNLTMGITL